MKKLLAILAICLLPGVAWGASYYGCGAGAINGDATWCAVGDVTNGVCAKDSGDYVAGATALAGTHTLYANGCTITIPSGTFTAAKLSTKGDGSKGAGGGFTANANDITVTLDANIEGGTTDCLTASNTAGTSSVINILTTNGGGTITTDATADADGVSIVGSKVTVNIGKSGFPVTITGGGAANGAINDTSTLTTKTVYANITAGTTTAGNGYKVACTSGTNAFIGTMSGSAAAANAIYQNGTGSTVTILGNCTGGTYKGFGYATIYNLSTTGTTTINGDCISNRAPGCATSGNSDTNLLTINGSIIGSTYALGAVGRIAWNPGTLYTDFRYMRIWSGSGTTYYYLGNSPNVEDVRLNKKYIHDSATESTGTLISGGSWAN